MTLTGVPLPDLDDLRWQGLVEEGRALIPAYAPDWTDHNVSDPGITLVELFAYLAELDLFTLNQLTPAQRRKLLALVGAKATPALPAQAMVEIALRPGAGPRTIAPGLQLEGRDPYGRVVPFRTLHPVTVQPGRLAALLTGGATAAPLSTDLTDLTTRRAAGEPLLVFGPDPGPGSALYLGFDLPAARPGGSELSLGVVPADPLPAETPHHSVRLGVELLTAGSSWARLSASDVHDGSRALTQEGRLTIRLPWSLAPRPATWRTGNPLAWMRIQIIGGRHDAAPALAALAMNAVQGVQAVPLTQTLTIAPGADVSGDPPSPGDRIDLDVHLDRQGRADRLGFAAPGPGEEGVVVLGHDPGVSLELAAGVFAGTGAPGQRIELAGAPVVAGTLHVGDGDAGWRLVDDFTASGRADADAVADLTAGTVDFGDGEHGRVPPPDSALLVRADLTAADRGNLAAGAVDPGRGLGLERGDRCRSAGVARRSGLDPERFSGPRRAGRPDLRGSGRRRQGRARGTDAGGDTRRLRSAGPRDARHADRPRAGLREPASGVRLPDGHRSGDGAGSSPPPMEQTGPGTRPAGSRGDLSRAAPGARHADRGGGACLRPGDGQGHGRGPIRDAAGHLAERRPVHAGRVLRPPDGRAGRNRVAVRAGCVPGGGALADRPGAGGGARARARTGHR